MPKLIFTTVGTSALQKLKDPVALNDDELSMQFETQEYSVPLASVLKQQLIQTLSHKTQQLIKGNAGYFDVSAEIASLVAMHRDRRIGPMTEADSIVLLYSDTLAGRVCAEANAAVLTRALGWVVREPEKISSLRADKPAHFLKGLEHLKTIVESHCTDPETRWFNITGGFKGTIPYAITLAWDYRMSVAFLFERSNRICVIPEPTNWPRGVSMFEEVVQSSRLGLGALIS